VIDLWAVNAVDSARRARLTDLRRTNPPGWERGRIGPALASPVDAVICELHVRDLTISGSSGVKRRGGYLGWCESGTTLPGRPDIHTALEHLVELGVTHVQLMPVQDFDGDDLQHVYSWGYMPAAHFSPEGTFASDPMGDGRCREIKHLIQSLHLRGIGVILDVVHNHAGKTAPFDAHAPGYYFRHWPDGTRSDGSGCGNEFRSESEQGRRFIIENLKFWVREYGIDGFRFDLMALIDRETILQAERELRALKPDVLLYGEPWAAGPSPIDGAGMDKSAFWGSGCGGFNDDFRNAIKGLPDGPQPGFIQAGWNRDAVRRGLLASRNGRRLRRTSSNMCHATTTFASTTSSPSRNREPTPPQCAAWPCWGIFSSSSRRGFRFCTAATSFSARNRATPTATARRTPSTKSTGTERRGTTGFFNR
jgi:pullulanase